MPSEFEGISPTLSTSVTIWAIEEIPSVKRDAKSQRISQCSLFFFFLYSLFVRIVLFPTDTLILFMIVNWMKSMTVYWHSPSYRRN
mmetsp:Transcript_15218/g.23834  ORF Transcript_15218/g.23834 Transcript_15218/m.23834 type:complete len:86 (+) Transcript_15218:1734-1991(+)